MEKEIIINKEFIWNEDRFRILSLKNTNGKAVVKICKRAEKDQLLAAYEKEREYGLPYMAMAGELTDLQLEIRESVSPLSDNFRGAFLAGDQAYEARFFGTDYWDPVIVCREPKWQEYQEKLKKDLAFYGLDSSCGWLFISFACEALSLEELQTSRLSLSADKVVIPGETFAVNGPGEEFCFVHPLRNTRHTLKVLQYEKTELPHEADEPQYPPYCVMMEYTVTPKLTRGFRYQGLRRWLTGQSQACFFIEIHRKAASRYPPCMKSPPRILPGACYSMKKRKRISRSH